MSLYSVAADAKFYPSLDLQVAVAAAGDDPESGSLGDPVVFSGDRVLVNDTAWYGFSEDSSNPFRGWVCLFGDADLVVVEMLDEAYDAMQERGLI